MKPEDFHLFEPLRFFLGDVPWSFLLETFLRGIFFYFLLLVSMRLMGKRMGAQLSRNEMAALSSLAAAIGVPIQAPDRGLVPPLVIAVVIVLGQRYIAARTLKSKKFEQATQDDIAMLVEDGRLNLDAMEEVVLPQERLFAKLRSESIEHLGQVKRLYMEANGKFTLLLQDLPQPGLTLIPDWDEEYLQEQKRSPDTFACRRCGQLERSPQEPAHACPRCQHHRWAAAVTEAAAQQ
ncbi:uncharacterized membrane protein YcaP (DUF421 family) [Hymenobacter luteus]|uniref:Uncharacterized membrane protein YcaP (DUF421 family) n=2 Tax=Hymenobacter TaxID=89966 RepID=A0A7W9T3D1_9BACT|nr:MULTISPECIES: YetF domain-containing protein [Hymenobacter]MBB4602950.1 uncharacterized membrane protein YcaP (DUF421 family) [Hymenobacter latericoloratus]MBB6060842.1 uncharacterized membrane protein YcaP (DUF421 family) [Hymenobacter luteus]